MTIRDAFDQFCKGLFKADSGVLLTSTYEDPFQNEAVVEIDDDGDVIKMGSWNDINMSIY